MHQFTDAKKTHGKGTKSPSHRLCDYWIELAQWADSMKKLSKYTAYLGNTFLTFWLDTVCVYKILFFWIASWLICRLVYCQLTWLMG